jgi:Ca-activated chloride channel family protein
MNRNTALVLVAAGAVAMASLLLTTRGDSQASKVEIASDTGKPAQPHTQPLLCGGDTAQPATGTAPFQHGTLGAALSSQKLLHNSTGEMFMAVDLAAQVKEMAERPALNLAIVIDRSGSMSGEKIVQAKSAALGLVDRLGVRDRVAVVQYDDTAQVILPSTTMDPAGKARARARIQGIRDNGGTNLHDGMALGRDEVLKNVDQEALKRVILLSDGVANVGVTDTPSLSRVASSAAEKGARITTVGLGLDYNEDLMEALAEYGRGQYYYVKNAGDLDTVFAGELQNIQATVATNSEIRLTPVCAGVEIAEVYGYATHKDGQDTVIRMADVFGGDQRKIVARLRVPASQTGTLNLVRVTMHYNDTDTRARKSAELTLGAEITGDAAAVERSANKDVVTAALEVESARAMREAADAYKRGDVGQATSINRAWRSKAEAQAKQYDLAPADTEELYDELDVQAGAIQTVSPNSDEGKAMVKGSKAKARSLSKKRK